MDCCFCFFPRCGGDFAALVLFAFFALFSTMDTTATSATARVDISAAAMAAVEPAAPSLAAPSKEAGCDVAVAALRFPQEEAGGCFPFFLGKLPSVPTATVPDFARVVRMMVRRALGRNEGGYWMIFVGKVMLWGGGL